jgi:hypothetical protein
MRWWVLVTQARERNVFVKNLGEGATDEWLRTTFSQFGMVRSARIMKDEIGNSKVKRSVGENLPIQGQKGCWGGGAA